MSGSILLRGGTLLVHDETEHVVPTKADLLIQDTKIAAIGTDLKAPQDVTVIDCTDKLISPGFIDTHRHVWQTQLKGRHGDHTLFEYMPADIFWGSLSGSLESIDAGTTTVLDHCHAVRSPDHAKQAINGEIVSGIRTVFCYTPTVSYTYHPSFTYDFSNASAPWVLDTWTSLASSAPYSDGKVQVGFGFDGFAAGKEVTQYIYSHVRKHGAKIITSHGVSGPMFAGRPGALETLSDFNLLGPDIVISHSTPYLPTFGALLEKTGAYISSTPTTELQMGHGIPMALKPEIYPHASLGIDCHSATTAFLPIEMRAILYSARSTRAYELETLPNGGKWDRSISEHFHAEKAFNLGTIGGAKAMGMSEQIGRIKEGYKADLIVWDGTTPAMLAAAQHNPIAAVVFHSGVRDVEYVIIDGEVRKAQGKLLDLSPKDLEGKGVLGSEVPVPKGKGVSWRDVVTKVLESREVLERNFVGFDFKNAEDVVGGSYGMDLGLTTKDGE